jgi:hypothetical protein
MIRLQFCGAARTVTGSQHLIEVNGQRILLECGMYQGKRAEAYQRTAIFHLIPNPSMRWCFHMRTSTIQAKPPTASFAKTSTFGSKADEKIGENTTYSVCKRVDPLSRHVRVGVQTGPRPA